MYKELNYDHYSILVVGVKRVRQGFPPFGDRMSCRSCGVRHPTLSANYEPVQYYYTGSAKPIRLREFAERAKALASLCKQGSSSHSLPKHSRSRWLGEYGVIGAGNDYTILQRSEHEDRIAAGAILSVVRRG